MRISDWSSDVCCSDRPSIHRTLSRAALGVNGYGWISALTPVHAECTAKRCVSRHARGQREHPGPLIHEASGLALGMIGGGRFIEARSFMGVYSDRDSVVVGMSV